MCVCFAMLGVPLGSASLSGGRGGGFRDLLQRLHHCITTMNDVHVCGCVHKSFSALE